MAISSSSPAVAARCAHLRAGVGAACSQNITDPRLGKSLLDFLETGMTANEALMAVVQDNEHIAYRQLTVVDRAGFGAAYSGDGCLGVIATAIGEGAVAAGNLLSDASIPQQMVSAFDGTTGMNIGDRLCWRSRRPSRRAEKLVLCIPPGWSSWTR